MVAAVTLLFVGIPTGTTTVDGGLGGDEIRFKGELPALEVWVGTEAGLRPLRSGERVSEGTRVNLVFDARGHRLATLAGQDGTGSVEIYDTLDVAGQTGLIEAPFALELDDAPVLTPADLTKRPAELTNDLGGASLPQKGIMRGYKGAITHL